MKPLTPKMEKFAILFVETGNACEAYRQSYNTKGSQATIKVKASQLCAKDNIRVTIDKLRAENRKRHAVTVESLTIELSGAQEVARAEGQAAAMVAATMGKAKLYGLLIDKTEVKSLSLVEVLNAANKS